MANMTGKRANSRMASGKRRMFILSPPPPPDDLDVVPGDADALCYDAGRLTLVVVDSCDVSYHIMRGVDNHRSSNPKKIISAAGCEMREM
jgi:hypothetical protein